MVERPTGRSRLVFATGNAGKVVELAGLLEGSGWAVERPPPGLGAYEETGTTFAANARGKALFAATRLDAPVLADDSGIEIDALGGEPGVRSARYVDETLTPDERNQVVLQRLAHVPPGSRGARFVCHLVLAVGADVVHETVGVCEGQICRESRGSGGFGYDPIFLLPDLGLTFAQLSRERKSALSHRGAAVRDMVEFLRGWRVD